MNTLLENRRNATAVLEGAATAEREPRRAGSDHDPSGAATTASFRLPANRASAVGLKAAGAVGLGLLSGFLLAEIPNSPGLTANIVVLGSLGLAGALALCVLACRDAFDRLALDAVGIETGVGPFRRRIEWARVTSWCMTFDDDCPNQLALYVEQRPFPELLNLDGMSHADHRALRKLVLHRLGEERN
jgi:hypothetical protein